MDSEEIIEGTDTLVVDDHHAKRSVRLEGGYPGTPRIRTSQPEEVAALEAKEDVAASDTKEDMVASVPVVDDTTIVEGPSIDPSPDAVIPEPVTHHEISSDALEEDVI